MTSSRLLIFSLPLLCGAFAGACGSDGGNKPDGGGGIGGLGGLGGGGGTGGSSDAGLDRTITGTGGTGGTTGGTGGTGGNPLAFCNGTMPAHSPTTTPGNSLIADFAADPAVIWGPWDPATSPVYGGRYANEPLTESIDLTSGKWHITGPVEMQKGFGLWFACAQNGSGYMGCTIDLSRYAGIQFTVRGNVGPSGKMGLSLGRAQNDTPKPDNCGSCVADADAGATCNGPGVQFEVPNDGKDHVIFLPWGAFTGGHPYDRLDPHQITGDYFFFNPPGYGLDGGVADASANPDTPADFDAATPDAATGDAAAVPATPDAAADGAIAGDAGTDPDASPDAARPSYTADIYIDDVQLVAY